MVSEELMKILDGARMIKVDSQYGLVMVWKAAHGLHVYDYDAREVAYREIESGGAKEAHPKSMSIAIA